jgi:hypothetical protein
VSTNSDPHPILDAIIIHVRYTGKEMGADDFKADRIFIPINLNNQHWALVVVELFSKR